MKKFVLPSVAMLVSGLAQAATVVSSDSEPSPYLIVLAAVALIGTIAHRRSKLKARS